MQLWGKLDDRSSTAPESIHVHNDGVNSIMRHKKYAYDLSRIFDLVEIEPDNIGRRSYKNMNPFNLDFRYRKHEARDVLMCGPGVYQIFFFGKLIYIGKFDTLDKGNVADERWRKHLETITMRGYRLGFESPDTVTELICLMTNTALRKSLESEKKKLTTRLKGTGVVCTRNRIAFANKNWVKFAKLKSKLPEGMFTVNYVRFTAIRSERVAEKRAKRLESALIAEYKPPCNREYKLANPSKDVTKRQVAIRTKTLIQQLS